MRVKNAVVSLVTMMVVCGAAIGAGPTSSAMPGDNGKPGGGNGIPPTTTPARAANAQRPAPAPAPAIAVALRVAQAVATECSNYALGVAVVNSEGAPILVYIPDGSRSSHAYTAIRKAYSAVQFKARTASMAAKAQQDAATAATIQEDPNLVAYGGGIPLFLDGTLVGALGVSGAEPGGHDEECGLKGLEVVRGVLAW